MLTRCISGAVLVVIALITMFIGGPLLAVTLLLVSLVAFRELTKALKCNKEGKGFNALEIVGLAGVVIYYLTVYFGNDTTRLMGIVFVFMASMFFYVFRFPKFDASQVVATVFSFLYAPVMLSFIYLTRSLEYGAYLVWLILISSWICDTCAYFVGVTIGKKRIFPVLSPKKSLEGCIGGVLGSAIVGALYAYLFMTKVMDEPYVIPVVAFISVAGAVMSMVGDLAASAIKRNHDIKDYGHLIPGHGGIMDRFDSVIVTAPMIYSLSVFLLGL